MPSSLALQTWRCNNDNNEDNKSSDNHNDNDSGDKHGHCHCHYPWSPLSSLPSSLPLLSIINTVIITVFIIIIHHGYWHHHCHCWTFTNSCAAVLMSKSSASYWEALLFPQGDCKKIACFHDFPVLYWFLYFNQYYLMCKHWRSQWFVLCYQWKHC